MKTTDSASMLPRDLNTISDAQLIGNAFLFISSLLSQEPPGEFRQTSGARYSAVAPLIWEPTDSERSYAFGTWSRSHGN